MIICLKVNALWVLNIYRCQYKRKIENGGVYLSGAAARTGKENKVKENNIEYYKKSVGNQQLITNKQRPKKTVYVM